MLILAYHTHCSGGGGGGKAGCEEASASDFPLPPFDVRSSRKAWIWLWTQSLLLLQACSYADLMGCNGLLSALEGGWADAAHGPPDITITFPGQFWAFMNGDFNMINKRRKLYGNVLEFMVCEGL